MPSQNEEDSVIEKLLPRLNGFYVDVGAFHPFEGSNTHRLYEKGWTGIIIEPQDVTNMWKKLRPNDVVIRKAASDKKGISKLYYCGQATSMEERWQIPKHNSEMIETDTLDNIMEEFPLIRDNCSFLSVDVEGHEWAVIAGMEFIKFRPKLIVIEVKEYVTGKLLTYEWEPKILSAGYKYLTSTGGGLNTFYSITEDCLPT
jgi:FkbM family methyltransferase